MTNLRIALAAITLSACALPGTAFAQLGGSVIDRLEAIQRAEKSEQAFVSAGAIVLGRAPQGQEGADWIQLMFAPEYAMSGQAPSGGVMFIDAVKFLKAHIAKAGGASLRAEAIDRAYREVYGRASSPVEQAGWDSQVKAGKAWYAPIVLQESAKLNASPGERSEMITRAYQYAEGRMPLPGDRQYWGSRSEHFREIVAAERNWLYTSGGATELVAVARRAWKVAYKSEPTDGNLKAVLVKATAGKMVYSELVKAL